MATGELINVLVFSKTSSYRHDSIPAGIAAIKKLADHTKLFKVDASEDAEQAITNSNLTHYNVIVLLHCTGDFLSQVQVDTLKDFVRAGGGIVGVHAAAAAMFEDEWYGALIGVHFDSHPKPEPGRVLVEDANHWVLGGSSERDGWMDEWYNFRTHPRKNANLKILLKGDASSFQGGKMGDDHPLIWCQEFEGGRSFYTALGHFEEAYTDEWYMGQLSRAIIWAAKQEQKNT